MWRAVFLALGITLILVGVESFMIDKVEVQRLRWPKSQATQSNFQFRTATFQTADLSKTQVIEIKEWMPWSFLALGSVVLIYTFTIPRRRSD